MALLFDRSKVLLMNVEATKGGGGVLDPAQHGIQCANLQFNIDTEETANEEITGFLDTATPQVSIPTCTLTGTVYCKPPADLTSTPEAGPIYRACTLEETFSTGVSTVYTPSNLDESVNYEYYVDGIQYSAVGVIGSGNFSFIARTGRWVFNFTLTGQYAGKAEVANPTPTYITKVAPLWKDGEALIDTVAYPIQEFTLDLGATTPFIDDPNDVNGYGEAYVGERTVRGTINPPEELPSTRDLLTNNLATNTNIALKMSVGTSPDYMEMDIAAARLLDETMANDNGIVRNTYSFAPDVFPRFTLTFS